MEENTERHLAIFKRHFRKGWNKAANHNNWTTENVEEKFNEEWQELVHSDEDGQEMIKLVTNCMDEYHYEMSEIGDAEKQVMTLGSELVGIFLERERLKSENNELRNEVDRLNYLLEVKTQRQKSNGLQIGSYKYRSKHI